MKQMTPPDDLLTLDECRKRLDLTEGQLGQLLHDGSMFVIDVDDVPRLPALFVDHALNRNRLLKLCRIIVPASPASRLDFLTSPQGGLSLRSPVEMLEDSQDFKELLREAVAWAAGWSRTTVTMYEGVNSMKPDAIEPLYAASTEIDPRRPLWKRASQALRIHENEWPLAPYPCVPSFTVFVERQMIGEPARTLEACVQVSVDNGTVAVEAKAVPAGAAYYGTFSSIAGDGLVDITRQVVDRLKYVRTGSIGR